MEYRTLAQIGQRRVHRAGSAGGARLCPALGVGMWATTTTPALTVRLATAKGINGKRIGLGANRLSREADDVTVVLTSRNDAAQTNRPLGTAYRITYWHQVDFHLGFGLSAAVRPISLPQDIRY
jgi:hypothetical protein